MISARQKEVGSALVGRPQKSWRVSTTEHTEARPSFETGFNSMEHASTNAREVRVWRVRVSKFLSICACLRRPGNGKDKSGRNGPHVQERSWRVMIK